MNNKQKLFILNAILIAIYLISFWMITESGYRCDDCYNANIMGITYLNGVSIWDLTKTAIKGWLDSGRFFPFSSYTYLLFALLKTRWSYKFAILVFTYINSMVFGKLIYEISHSKRLQYLFLILFPVCIPLSCEYNSALYSYHLLMHVLLLWLTLSMLFLLYYKERKKWYWGFLGGLTFFLALGTYEVAFAFILPMILFVWKYDRGDNRIQRIGNSIRNCAATLKYHGTVYVIVIGINVWLRLRMQGQSYDGTSFHWNLRSIIYGFTKQLSAGIPLVRYYVTVGKAYTWKDEIGLLLHSIAWQQIILIILTVLCMYLVAKLEPESRLEKEKWAVFVLGGSTLLLPACIISLSQKYQLETQWGMGHLPAYIQAFGFTLLFAMLLYGIQWLKNCKIRRVMALCSGCFLILLLIVNQYMGWSTVKNDNLSYRYPRECVEQAVDCGILDTPDTMNRLITTTDYVIDYLGPSVFYSYIAERAINAENINNLTGYQAAPGDYVIYTYANEHAGYCMVGECQSIERETETDAQIKNIYISNYRLYIFGDYNNSEQRFQLQKKNGDTIDFGIMDLNMIKEIENGTLYEHQFDDYVDIKSFSVLQ